MGLDFDQLYPARFMKAGEFQGKDVTLKVSGVAVEELESEKGKKGKGIVSFERKYGVNLRATAKALWAEFNLFGEAE